MHNVCKLYSDSCPLYYANIPNCICNNGSTVYSVTNE